MPDEDIDEMFENIDSAGSGAIEYSEFIIASTDMSQFMTEERLQAAFQLLDSENKGYLNTKDIPIE